jgi:hypothetical protein
MSHHLISRRQMLAGTAAAGAVGLAGFPARAEVNWKKYSGTSLEVSLAKGPRGDNLQKYIKEFTELTGVKVSWDPQMIPFGRAWAQGRSLAELMERIDSSTDVSGDLIGAFRRARDVVGQVSALYDHDPDKKKALDDVCRKVRRDEVEVVD